MKLLEIAVAAPLEQTLTYKLDTDLLCAGSAGRMADLVGRRVLVPLGRRKVTGYILSENATDTGEFTLRGIKEVLDLEPIFPAELIPLFRWISRYYHYPIGEVIKAALPGGLAPRSVKQIEVTRQGKEVLATGDYASCREWCETLMHAGRLSPTATRDILNSKSEKKYLKQLLDAGVLELRESLTGDSVKEKRESCYQIRPGLKYTAGEREPDSAVLETFRGELNEKNSLSLTLAQAKTLYYIAALGVDSKSEAVPRKELLALYKGAGRVLPTLIDDELVIEKNRRVFRSPLGEQLEFFPPPQELTDEQQRALKQVYPAIRQGRYHPFLLYGVTGSGKTEVYLQAAAETLKQGRSVLVIVPEIALATQLEAHFISRFGEQVVLLHSGLTAAEKFDQWALAFSGKARIVIGARSAVFAPLKDPGLIVVDEEHDSGLKQDDSLRYNGRDVAVVRANQQGCPILLASATPSVVSYHNALLGKYTLLTMSNRVGERKLPKVSIIDLRQKATGKKSIFRAPLQNALKANLERGKQSVILINRRGFSANVICQECGNPVQCRDCHVSLTLHRSSQKLLCHYCGFSVHEKTVCETCGATSLVPVGFGTERVEEELKTLLPEARIARLDADTAYDRKTFLSTLQLMRKGEIDVLVGTQMVAKGHHFPGVTLVGVVWADGGLAMPDYRAAEKTFQLVTQVTGRAGRGDDPGEVFIQTMRPEHYAILYARAHRYEDMVEKELALRQNPKFPPFVRLVVIHIHGESEQRVQSAAGNIAAACRKITDSRTKEIEILGPAPSPIDRVKKKYRWQVMVKSTSIDALHDICSYIQANQQELGGGRCRVIVDVDPENMM